MRIAVYPGSFDPITNGHLDIIKRASRLYDRLVVGVLDNINKKPLFSALERKEMIDAEIKDLLNVSCDVFSGLLVDFAKQQGATVIVKGLRTVADFEYEFQMALLNKALNPEYETMFMMTNSKYSYISSSMVKEVAKYKGELEGLIPPYVIEKIKDKIQ
ncbi:MAG TPA: pantetheine-phosphate adenylyltransferase [Clostridiales bacterium]|nr:pantetheine-phosphate adenylyltransferase [Clostridiales bacterium]